MQCVHAWLCREIHTVVTLEYNLLLATRARLSYQTSTHFITMTMFFTAGWLHCGILTFISTKVWSLNGANRGSRFKIFCIWRHCRKGDRRGCTAEYKLMRMCCSGHERLLRSAQEATSQFMLQIIAMISLTVIFLNVAIQSCISERLHSHHVLLSIIDISSSTFKFS